MLSWSISRTDAAPTPTATARARISGASRSRWAGRQRLRVADARDPVTAGPHDHGRCDDRAAGRRDADLVDADDPDEALVPESALVAEGRDDGSHRALGYDAGPGGEAAGGTTCLWVLVNTRAPKEPSRVDPGRFDDVRCSRRTNRPVSDRPGPLGVVSVACHPHRAGDGAGAQDRRDRAGPCARRGISRSCGARAGSRPCRRGRAGSRAARAGRRRGGRPRSSRCAGC